MTAGPNRAAARSYLRAAGMQDADFDKPMIGIANGHSTITPCYAGLQPLADAAVAAIRASQGLELFTVNRGATMAAVATGNVQNHAINKTGHDLS